MPRCTCAGNSCNCLIQAGSNVTVAGKGTASDPYIVSASGGGGGSIGITPAVGSYLGPAVANPFNSNSAGGLFASGDVYACPIFVHSEITIDALGHFGGGEAVGVRLLVYASNADGYPDTLHATATYTSSGGNSSRVATLGVPVVFPPGL